MVAIVSNEICIENPADELKAYIEKELIIPNPDYIKKKRLGYWVGTIDKELRLFRKVGNKYYLPTGVYKDLRKNFPTIEFTFDFPEDESFADIDIHLYDYQAEAADAVLSSNFGILKAPCGSGKTEMGIYLASKCGRVLWITHTQDLLKQSYDRASKYMDRSELGTITGGKVDIGSRITFATVQTLYKQDLIEYKYAFNAVIVDECHRVAGSPTQVTMFSKVINSLSARHKYGLSATVHRADGLVKTTYALLGPVLADIPEETVKGRTVPVNIMKVETATPIDRRCLDTDGTLIYSNLLEYLAENKERNQLIAEMIYRDYLNGHSILVLSKRLSQLNAVRQILFLKNVPETHMRYIDGKSTKESRAESIEAMRNNEAKILFASYNLAKEGLDIPNLDRLHLATPEKDFAVVTQSIGRVGRVADGKDNAFVYDYVDDIGWCDGAYRRRKAHYRKKGCKIYE